MNGAKIKPLVWHNFDAWTHWAEAVCGTYHVEERNGYWQVELRVGGLVHAVTETDDTTPADLDAAKAAAQADYSARILAALEAPDAGVVAELVEAAKALKAIVEEIRGAMEHGTWRDGKGQRLKDTPEWVAFYNALALIAHNTTEG